MNIISFMKCLTTMILSLSYKDVKTVARQYAVWEKGASLAAAKYGIGAEFSKLSARLQTKWEFTGDMADAMGVAMKKALPKMVADTDITHTQIAFLRDLGVYFRKDSGTAWVRLSKNASILNDNQLSVLFLSDSVNEVADLTAQQNMEKIVFELTGRKNDPILSQNELRDGRETHPKLLVRYAQYRKEFKEKFTQAILRFVRLSGKPLIDVKTAKNYLRAMGCDYLPNGFIGRVDEKGKLYTTAGKALHGTMVGQFVMNPNYDPKTDDTYYARLKGDQRGELRTQEFLKRKRTDRHEKVEEFSDNIESHRRRWLKDMNSLDNIERIIATFIETIHITYGRVGTEGNKNKGEDTFGVSTLRVKQVRILPTGIKISYPGKKSTINTHIIKPTTQSNRKIIAMFKELVADKKPLDRVFKVGSHNIWPRDINNYLKSIGVKITIHKFRHSAATLEAKKMLDKAPFNKKNPPSQSQAEHWIREEAKRIGEMLHHRSGSGDNQKVTSTTAFQAYIQPSLVADWFRDLGLRPPPWLPPFDE